MTQNSTIGVTQREKSYLQLKKCNDLFSHAGRVVLCCVSPLLHLAVKWMKSWLLLALKHARLFFLRKKIHPTRSYLRAFYRQAAPNFAYSFIKFEEKIPVYLFISAYLFIRELRVSHLNKSVIIDMLLLHTVISLVPKRKSFYKLVLK
jgi:hypothetical protein